MFWVEPGHLHIWPTGGSPGGISTGTRHPWVGFSSAGFIITGPPLVASPSRSALL